MGKRIAIIHDWLNGMRGGEKVLEGLLDIFPEAEIYTLFLEESKISEKIKSHKIFTSELNRFKSVRKRYRHFLPVFPRMIEDFNLKGYELIISSSHCVAKGIIPHPYSTHISYVHSPMRYAWDQYYPYFENLKWMKKSFVRKKISELRTWDVSSSRRVDHFLANSNFVRERIWRYYRRDAKVVFPPVDTEFFTPGKENNGDYFIIVSALVPYKKVNIVVDSFNKSGDKLIVVGKGPEEKTLKKSAGNNIKFKKDVSSEEIRNLYRNSKGFVYAGIEDFGITFVEANSCGIPVISYGQGGVTDIVNKDNGILYSSQNSSGLLEAIEEFKGSKFESSKIRASAMRFTVDTFRNKFKDFIGEIS